MKCSHIPESKPAQNPDGYLWASCSSQLSQMSESLFIPQCDEEGNYFDQQCNSESCFCMDKFGEIIPDSESVGDANCGKCKTFFSNTIFERNKNFRPKNRPKLGDTK